MLGVRSKLIAPLLVTATIVFLLVQLVLKPGWIESEHNDLISQQKELLGTLGNSVTEQILSGDYAAMYSLIDTELKLKTRDWRAMTIFLEDGTQVYPLEKETNEFLDNNYIDFISHKLALDGKPLANIQLYVDWSRQVEIVDQHISDIEYLLLSAFFMLLVAALTVQSMLIRMPLEKLERAASELVLGNYDLEIPQGGQDEMGRLSRTFMKMRESIMKNETALKQAASEAAIAERLLQENQHALIREHAVVSTALDETKALNEKLQHTQNELEHFKKALDEHAVVSIADEKGDITFVNERFCQISGYSRDELIGNNHRMLKSDMHNDEYFKDLWKNLSRGEIWHGDLCNMKKSGEPYWVDASIVPFLDDDGKPYKFVAIRTDITDEKKAVERLKAKTDEIKRAHAELKQSHQQALQSEKLASVGQLAAGMAHEINTPIQFVGDNTRFLQEAFADLNSVIKAYESLATTIAFNDADNELLIKVKHLSDEVEVDYLVDEVPNAIKQTLDGIERVSKIVLSMKEFSHPGSDQKEVIDISHAIQSTITVSRNEWKYNAELITDFDESMTAVPCFAGELNQVVLNIIINASHAINDSKKEQDSLGTITICTRQEKNYAVIQISDTGTGMPASVRKRIFEPFYTTKGVGKGTGQGLAIAYSVIVEKHGGKLDVESTPGKGTTFTIRLPMTEHEDVCITNEESYDASAPKFVSSGSV